MSINKKHDKNVKPFSRCPEHGVLCTCPRSDYNKKVKYSTRPKR